MNSKIVSQRENQNILSLSKPITAQYELSVYVLLMFTSIHKVYTDTFASTIRELR
jgi:hypothetical protein